MNILSRKSDYTKPYNIGSKRISTLRHAIASAVAPHEQEVSNNDLIEAMTALGQDPDNLSCVYCGRAATSLDHFCGLVVNSEWSGYGNSINNRVPACEICNPRKGNRDAYQWMRKAHPHRVADFVERMGRFHRAVGMPQKMPPISQVSPEAAKRLCGLEYAMVAIMRQMDEEAAQIRAAYAELNGGQNCG